ISDKNRIISNSPCTSLFFTPDAKLIAWGNKSEIAFYDTATGKVKRSLSEPLRVQCLSPFFDNGTKIACLNMGGQIHIWDVPQGKVLHTREAGGDPRHNGAITITLDQKTLITRGGGPFKFWTLPDAEVRKEFQEVFGTHQRI